VRRVCIALFLYACSAPTAAGEAFVSVTVTAQTAGAQITKISVTVTPAGTTRDLTRDAGGTFSGKVSVPPGLQTVTATAWAGGTAAGSGSGSVTVIKGATVLLSILALDITGPAPAPDHSPVITSLSASASTVEVGDQVSLAAVALDADGDGLTVLWTAAPAGCGAFAAPNAASTSWTAAAVGTCVVAVRASARLLSDTRSVSILVTPVVGVPAPTLVQHVSSTMNPPTDGTTGNNYKFTLPNPVMAGNCLVLGISYVRSATRTVRVTDSNANAWRTVPEVSTTDGINLTSSIFVLPNAIAGVTSITVTFDAPILTFQYTVSEFNDVDPVSPVSGGSGGLSTAPNLATPAFTPANNNGNGGNLIWSYFIDNEFGTDNGTRKFAPATPFTLLDADIGWTFVGLPHASQYFVQATAGPIAPAMTATMSPGNDGYNGLAVALRAGFAGSPAPATGIRVQRVSHFTNSVPPTTWNFQFPTKGNLIVGVVAQSDIIDITSITDSKSNTYVRYEPETDEPQIWYAVNATPDPNLRITVTSAGVPVNSSFLWYDISGAASSPPDAIAHLTGGGIDFRNNRIDDAPLITPPSLGLTIAAISFGTGPATGLTTGSPPGAIFDYVSYAGELDIDRMDNADGRAHLYNTDLSAEHYNWILNHSMGTTASATAVHFRAAP
jgi:hypothetical protein